MKSITANHTPQLYTNQNKIWLPKKVLNLFCTILMLSLTGDWKSIKELFREQK
jgi:hypothetical protein